jgi:formate hydrogenlyase subunit 6/NADH:ubiquinone oxidoreductase subunit I
MSRTPLLPRVDMSKCTLCGICVDRCRCHAVEMTQLGPVFHCPGHCPVMGCPANGDCWWECEEVCPEGAIECPFEIVLEGDEGSSSSPD